MSQRPSHAQETRTLNPLALCLALWLGLMACGLGAQRLADEAWQGGVAGSVHLTAAQLMPAVWRR